MNNIKVGKISKISASRILDKCSLSKNLYIEQFGISKKYLGEDVSISILGSGLPSHEKIPKASIFENFTSEKDPMIDTMNFSTIGAGLITGEDIALLPDAEILFPKIIDNKGSILLSSLLSGLIWSCIKQVNIILLPCSIQDKFLPDLQGILEKINKSNITVVMPIDKNETSLQILNTGLVIGVKTAITKNEDIEISVEKNNLLTISYPKNFKVKVPYGVYKFARLLTKEISPILATSIVGGLYNRRHKKNLTVNYKVIHEDLLKLKAPK